jgi:hypothetical protein
MSKKESIVVREKFLENLKVRFYKALDYLILFVYLLVVSICALLVDYILILVLSLLVADDIEKFPIIAQAFIWFKIGSGFLIFIAAIVHSFFSAASQIRNEVESFR